MCREEAALVCVQGVSIQDVPILNSAPARAEIQQSTPNKLLERNEYGQRMDDYPQGQAVGSNSQMEAVESVDGPSDRGGEGVCIPERIQGRRAAEMAGASETPRCTVKRAAKIP